MTQTTLEPGLKETGMAYQTHTVALGAREFGYLAAGEGEPLLVLHTSGGPLWTPLLEMLAATRRVVMPILPGFGGSDLVEGLADPAALAGWVAQFKAAVLGGEALDVFGGSFGGQVALHLAADHPGLVRDLVLEAPSGVAVGAAPPPPGKPVLFAHPEKAEGLMPSPEIAATNSAAFRAYGGPALVDEGLLAKLDAVTMPVLVIQGTCDAVTPVQAARYLAGALPNCKMTYVYDAGHGVQVDQAEAMFKVVRHFLDKGPAFIVADRAYA
ncbi:alpha/beta fold hydrolase [Novosphingobium profundi]|uniref:alpha/beta fold hydrolase n=1 Tax=Novosphingobium profundi TaxID=1774954 RepID=UPI001BD921F8|nr:alpha/beta fold hydrolase [Novosphingobium profundi]MBT0670672.1 alpha/beta fold hydrolase [Novosphingobium profundi]